MQPGLILIQRDGDLGGLCGRHCFQLAARHTQIKHGGNTIHVVQPHIFDGFYTSKV